MSIALVKQLRDETGAGLADCQKAVSEAAGDVDKARRILREKGLAKAAKKATRTATDGAVGSYIHPGGKIGVLIEVNCETDFVAKTDEFQQLVKDLAMQVAAAAPRYVSREEVPADEIESERGIYRKQAEASGKPPQVIERIVDGQVERFYKDIVLLEQAAHDAQGTDWNNEVFPPIRDLRVLLARQGRPSEDAARPAAAE